MFDPDTSCALVAYNPDKVNLSEGEISIYLSSTIGTSFLEGTDTFLVALNSDIQVKAAEAIIQLQGIFPDEIKLCVIESHERSFPKGTKAKKRYKKILKKADEILKIPVHCVKRANDACNEWLLDHVDHLIPIYTGDRVLYRRMVEVIFEREKGITYSKSHMSENVYSGDGEIL